MLFKYPFLAALCLITSSAFADKEIPLSSLNLSQARQGWGNPRANLSVGGKPLSIAGKKYTSGWGTHAPSELRLDLKGDSLRFTAKVGVDDEDGKTGPKGSAVFVVEGDGKTLWTSPVMRGGMPAEAVDLDLTGVQKLVLKVNDAGDNTRDDHVDWVEANFRVKETAPVAEAMPPLPPRWSLGENGSTFWPVAKETRLPHTDFIEQGGLGAGQVVNYTITDQRFLQIRRQVIWPGLRLKPNLVHDTLVHTYTREAEPVIAVDGVAAGPMVVDRVLLDGTLTFEGSLGKDLAVTRNTFPSRDKKTTFDNWTLRNTSTEKRTVTIAPLAVQNEVEGPYGINILDVSCTAPDSTVLLPGGEMRFSVLFSGRLKGDSVEKIEVIQEETARRSYVKSLWNNLRLETPQPELDQAFTFSKLRVAEAINMTKAGMMLAPGGLAYYAACWTNDNVEYAGPFFPFLGDEIGNQASLNTYNLFATYMKPDYGMLPTAIIAEGTGTWAGAGDRGDAAMYAYGCSRFCLALGDRTVAEKLWPAIQWALEYCQRKMIPEGAIASKSDELEGRFPTGKANLSTSSLYYGGLRSAADLARALGKNDEGASYDKRADEMAKVIEKYFGATVEGFATYRYYDGNEVLRAWICLPLTMGLMDRRAGTLDALFSPRLWTADGLATQAGEQTFWDRSTLYGLRAAFEAGDTARALDYLSAYTKRRLLGEHVPYPVEAWPEGGQRHLSSENALYCRIYTEGLFGILPTGLDRFRCTPRLPQGWPRMALRSIRAFNRNFDVVVERKGQGQQIQVLQNGKSVFEKTLAPGESADVQLP